LLHLEKICHQFQRDFGEEVTDNEVDINKVFFIILEEEGKGREKQQQQSSGEGKQKRHSRKRERVEKNASYFHGWCHEEQAERVGFRKESTGLLRKSGREGY